MHACCFLLHEVFSILNKMKIFHLNFGHFHVLLLDFAIFDGIQIVHKSICRKYSMRLRRSCGYHSLLVASLTELWFSLSIHYIRIREEAMIKRRSFSSYLSLSREIFCFFFFSFFTLANSSFCPHCYVPMYCIIRRILLVLFRLHTQLIHVDCFLHFKCIFLHTTETTAHDSTRQLTIALNKRGKQSEWT